MATALALVNGQVTEVEIAAGGSSVPTLATAPVTVPANSQVLFTEQIDLDGQELILDGVLVEVS
jgi:hypothetical protein